MFVSAIVLAAGKGKRFRSRIPKPFVSLAGRSIIEYCLGTFGAIRDIKQIIIAVSPEGKSAVRKALERRSLGEALIVSGGARRQDSVRNALRAVDPRAQIVLVHDGVRPFVRPATVSALIRSAAGSGAAIAAVPAKATIKKVSGSCVKETLRREDLWEAQTPQAFKRDILVEAYRAGGGKTATDDASLVERLGIRVAIVRGEYTNIKITTPEDLVIAEVLLKMRDCHCGQSRF